MAKKLAKWKADVRWKIDMWIYAWSYPAITRVTTRSNGMAYLTYLTAKAYSEQNPPTPEAKESAELFFESMRDYVKVKEFVRKNRTLR